MGLNHGWRGPNIVKDGLVLYLDAGSPNSYPGSGTTWKDISKVNQNNGTLINGPTFSSGNGGSIVFDGVDDFVSTNNFSLSQVTFDFWFLVTNKGGGFHYVMSYGNNSVGNMISISISNQNYSPYLVDRELYCFIGGGDPSLRPTGFLITYGSTYNVVLTITNSSSMINLYVNGTNYPVTNSDIFSLGNVFNVGRWFQGANNLRGNIFNGKVYNRALSASEVLQNYNATKGRFGL
jgi:hypothetical protein